MTNKPRQLRMPSVTRRALDLDLVELIATTLKESVPSVSMDLALRYAESIAIALYRDRYLPSHDL